MQTNKRRYKKVAEELGCATMTVFYMVNGKPDGKDHFTFDRDIAVRVSQLTGKPPIEHINPKVREAYGKAWPELWKKPIKAKTDA
jgi:hypothetical protein